MQKQTLQNQLNASCRTVKVFVSPIFYVMAVLATIASVLIILLIGMSVIMRYFTFTPFRFTEELVGLLMTTAFFLSLPMVTIEAKHVRVLILVSSLPEKLKMWATSFACLFGLIFFSWFFYLCIPWIEFAYVRQIKTEVGRLLMYPWMSVLPLSMLLTMVAFIIRGVLDSTESPK
ncbi:TRAP transporter small permease [Alphaproteobacteria bacterium]|nr:TRAP transporter small permease [Alphaproteobacteria bacterium]